MSNHKGNEEYSARGQSKNNKICILSTLLAATTLTALTFMVALIVTLVNKNEKIEESGGESMPQWPSPSTSPLGVFKTAAVAADNGACSEIGRNIMIRGGNAVDAVIASTFCIGVMDSQSAGIGGGHFMTIYNRTTKSCYIIDARESAPSYADRDMFANETEDVAARGWRSIAIPGEVYGLRKAFDMFGSGRVEWYDLLEPTIRLCRYGYVVSGSLATAIKEKTAWLTNETTMQGLFYNEEKGRLYQEGEVMKRPVLADTLEALANSTDPIHLFYRGDLAQTMINDFKDNNANISLEDFSNYTIRHGPDERPAIQAKIGGTNLMACGPPPPSSAAITISMLKIMSQFNISPNYLNGSVEKNVETYHRMIEALKYAYAARERLGDMDFLPDALELARNFTSDEFAKLASQRIGEKSEKNESMYYFWNEPIGVATEDHGTAHISVLDEEGNAVGLTSTINLYFGSLRRSVSTDIIWNDDMDDFSSPDRVNSFGYAPSPSNFIVPGKRPLSSMTPVVLYDDDTGDVKMVAGSAGGSRIISSTANVITRLLWLGNNVKEAVDAPRLHNQLHPFQTTYEKGFPEVYVDKLRARGQNLTVATDDAIVCIITSDRTGVYANSDYRKKGAYPAGF